MNKFILPLFILLAFSLSLKSQVCMGNLGDNIFTDGDFGSGSANLNTSFQNIAPGYNFTTAPPPGDGSFTIANSTNWAGLYSTWLRLEDNSDDPNGYMMVVNASNEPGLFYDQTVTDLCENTLYEFSADVINLIKRGVADHNLPNITFLLDGLPVASSGDIPQDEAWHNYGVLFTTSPGQTTVNLSIRNNAPGGIGNDLALDNISFRTCGDPAQILPREVENICENGSPLDLNATIVGNQYPDPSVQWQRSLDGGATWEDIPGATTLTIQHTDLRGGEYFYRYLLAGTPANLLNVKCRIVSNVKIVYVQPKFWSIVDTICEGVEYFHKGELLTETGTYVDSLTSSLGCDSVVTLDLTVLSDVAIEADFQVKSPACSDETEGEILIENISAGTPPYLISLNGSTPSPTTSFRNLAPGFFDLLILDKFGCELSRQLDLNPSSSFSVDIGEDLSILLGEQVDISVKSTQMISDYDWQPEADIDCPNCPTLNFFPPRTMTVILNATDELGCQASDSLNIEVTFEQRFFIPSAFSPNNDGINDFFTVNADIPNVQAVKKLQVFDRWGNLLFDNKDFQPNIETEGWNGEFKGKPLDSGIYTYLAELLFLTGESEVFGGDVTLLR